MKVLALAIVMLFVTVPAYAQQDNKEVPTEIILKGKILAFSDISDSATLILTVKHKGRLFFCYHSAESVACYE